MKMFRILFLLPCLMAANVEKRTMEIHEHGTTYHQTVTFDFDRNVQIIHVPAHNDIVESRTIFDFNEGVFMESQPLDKRCYLKEIPATMATMDQMFTVLSNRKAPLVAATTPVLAKHFGIVSELSLAELTSQEMREECKGHKIFVVAELEEGETQAPRASFSPAPVNPLLRRDGCSFHTQCFWQTCKFGSDSCFWTVNCPAGDTMCNDMIHNSNFHHNGDPISCTACFNTHCKNSNYDCMHDWHVNCQDGATLDHAVKECGNDETLGNDCGATRCDIPSDEEAWAGGKGKFDCVQDYDHPAYVLEDHLCMFTCASTYPGGFIQCKHDGKYEDHTMCA